MKNLKSILNFLKLDFAAVQIFISVIAILFAGMVNGESVNTAQLDSHKPSVRTLASDPGVCPVACTAAACDSRIQEAKSYKTDKADALQLLSIRKLVKPNARPICSSPSEKEQIRNPFLSQNG